MDIKTHYTSAEVLSNPENTQDAFCSCDGLSYEMTESELQWIDFIKGTYSIADYLVDNMHVNEQGKSIVNINSDFSRVLDMDNDGSGKALLLSDNTALQAIFFYNYQEPE